MQDLKLRARQHDELVRDKESQLKELKKKHADMKVRQTKCISCKILRVFKTLLRLCVHLTKND